MCIRDRAYPFFASLLCDVQPQKVPRETKHVQARSVAQAALTCQKMMGGVVTGLLYMYAGDADKVVAAIRAPYPSPRLVLTDAINQEADALLSQFDGFPTICTRA